MQDAFQIERVEDPEEKAEIVSEVLLDLPEWFGLPESTKAYINGSRQLPLWAARKHEEIVGFITLRESSPETGDIHCLGVKKAYHRKGIGSQLYLALEKYAKEKYKYLQVKTVEEGYYAEYDQTVAFFTKQLAFLNLRFFQLCGTNGIHV